MRLFMLIALIGAAAGAHAADAYKWTDANGVVHYTDTEPGQDVKAQRMHLAGTAIVSAGAAADDQAGVDAPGPKATPPADNTLASAVQSAEKRCEQARSNLEVLQSKFAVGLDNGGTGKAEVLDDQARQRQIAGAQTLIATYCK